MAKTLGSLAVGSKVKDSTTKFLNQPIIWKIADKNHSGYPSNSVTLITERCIAMRPFDAMEANNSNSDRQNYGNNRYSVSNIRQWLNSDAAAGAWYSAQHTADAPPTTANITNGNAYDTNAGFLNAFSASFKAALLSTTLTVAKNTVTDGGGSETITNKVFLASSTEIGLANENGIAEGTLLAMFSDNASRIAQVTTEGIADSTYTNNPANNNTACSWWPRTPEASNSRNPRLVGVTGTLGFNRASHGSNGVRPLCNLSSSILVSDTTDSDGCYTITWSSLPSPTNLTTYTPVKGKPCVVSWDASTGAVSGYILERAYNGGSFTQLYKGANLTYTDNISSDWDTVQYRVKAYDSKNVESVYATTDVINVIINVSPPVINGGDGDLGLKSSAFTQAYNITNPDVGVSKEFNVVEEFDGKEKRSYTAVSGEENTFEITHAEWIEIFNGPHAIKITVTDNYEETAVRIFTFTKNETEIELTLAEPFDTDAAATNAVMAVIRQIPAGAELTVEACNNAYDDFPDWEDVTSSIVSGKNFYLSNTTKTAEQWGFNFRIKVKRLSAEGDCFIQSAGGNFE